MTDLPPPSSIAERRHGNGIVARVTYFASSGAFQSSIYTVTPGDAQNGPVWTGHRAEARARAAADALAHPDCTGEACAEWVPWEPKGSP